MKTTYYDNKPEAWHDINSGLVEDAEERSTEHPHESLKHGEHREQ